jgi:hypothetical protein
MGVIPMKEEAGQEIYTRDHGVVKVDKKSWQDGRFHIVLCPNGAYQNINGLPVKSEEELVEAFGGYDGNNVDDLKKAVNWFRNRHDQLENPVRPISFHPDGYPVFEDGSVPDFDDLYSFFKPGPILTASILALQKHNERKGTGQAPKELRKAAPPSVETVTESSSQEAAPVHNPEKYSPKARSEAKRKAARAKARAAKAKTAQAEAQVQA